MRNEPEKTSLNPRLSQIDFQVLLSLLEGAALHLEKNKEIVNALNVFPVPDGDTGTNMHLTLLSTLEELNSNHPQSMREFAEALTKGSLLGARGNSGVILSQLFRGFGRSIDGKEKLTIIDLAEAFGEAARTAYKAVMKPVEGTILTVAREASLAASKAKEMDDLTVFLEEILFAAQVALANTPHLLPVLKEAGVVDSGGQGLVFLIEGAIARLKGVDLPIAQVSPKACIEKEEIFREELDYRYDTQFLIRGCNLDRNVVESRLKPLGDSLLVIGGGDLVRVHIHSNQPTQLLEASASFGSLDQVIIEDMIRQHEDFKQQSQTEKTPEGIAVISVYAGEGFEEIFKSLGVAGTVMGGQSMNPSTQEILQSIENVRKAEVIVLPNNANVINTALQAKSMGRKKIAVVGTRNLPQGIAACLTFQSNQPLEENVRAMERAIQLVHCGEVTYAVRDGGMNGFSFQKGAIIGFVDGTLSIVGEDPQEVCLKVVEELTKNTSGGIVGIYRGEEIPEEEAEDLLQALKQSLPLAEVDLQYGGQPYYYYVVSFEE